MRINSLSKNGNLVQIRMTLNFRKQGNTGEPLIILHGLFGSLDNWQSIAKELSANYIVYSLDQRNHGKSFHSNDINYEILAQDLADFMEEQHIPKANILGHSMGGKVAMKFALTHPEKVIKLLVADIGPIPYEGDHLLIFKAMMEMPLSEITSRQEAETFLEGRISSFVLRQFILKNLGRNGQNFEWKPNVNALFEHYHELMNFDTASKKFLGTTLFIRGGNSDYINIADFNFYQSIFPSAELITISDAGHWLHAEQPEKFIQVVKTFIG